MAIEAVIRTDGTRPTLLVRDDAIDPTHSLAGDWADTLAGIREALRSAIRAIGRIEPADATSRNFFGTGWVVDADRGLVLTNLHVLAALWQRLPHLMARTATGFRVYDGVFLDFAAESGSTRTRGSASWRPPRPRSTAPASRGWMRRSCGSNRSRPTTGAAGRGATRHPCRLRPRRAPVQPPVVLRRRFPGARPGSPRDWVFGHDATTLGGNSGSPVLAWGDGAFGLHFAGASVDTNCAHAVSACADALHSIAVDGLSGPAG